MAEGPGNIYENKETATAERQRLQTFEFPTQVSEQVIGEDLDGKIVLDLGAGPNTALSKFTEKHGGMYIAFDTNEAFLASQKEGGSLAVRGSVGALPFKENSADIVHTRFVLMHLSPEQRTKAIKEAIQAARARALFLEYDWGARVGNETIRDFCMFAVAFMQSRHIDPFMGDKLAQTVQAVVEGSSVSITERRINRGPGNYYKELISFARAMREVVAATKQEALLVELDELISRLNEESLKEVPEPSTGADIVVVEVVKSQPR